MSDSKVADAVASELDADVLLYNGEIVRQLDRHIIDECIKRQRRKNVLMVLVTMGGDANAAYRIARCLQEKYERVVIYVSGYCKSAGTLMAIGAHELVFSDHGELGPLDVQMSKKDDLWETQSGLTVMDALSALQQNAFDAFEKFFLDIERRSDGTITLRTAAEIATEMATGVFAPLYEQVDPLHVGEAVRAMTIAGAYGRRLLKEAENISSDALDLILSAYPTHGFVIDRQEAEKLFDNVRGPTSAETELAEELGDAARWPVLAQPTVKFLSSEHHPGSKTRKGSSNTTEEAAK